jgi:beta-galactosidase
LSNGFERRTSAISTEQLKLCAHAVLVGCILFVMKYFLAGAALYLGLFFALPVSGQNSPPTIVSPRERINFNADWRFHLGDPDDANKGELDYDKLKDFFLATGNDFTKGTPVARPSTNPGADVSFVKPDFDDSAWLQLNLPHDWAIEGPFDINAPGETGKLPYSGQAWYRKHFTLPASDNGRRIFLEIDGAMSYSCVWVNGKIVGGWPYGYSSYELELTPYLNVGYDNVISIRLNNPNDSSRWYPGAGIYRNVWLVKTSPLHIAHWGTYVSTPDVSQDSATIDLKCTVQNQASQDVQAYVTTNIFELDSKGQKSAQAVDTIRAQACTIPSGGTQMVEGQTQLLRPKLWDTQNPQRYVAVTDVIQNFRLLDRYETPFGIRSIKFDPQQGFLLNGQHVTINGVCDHQDLGALGTAFNTRAAERQLEILKEMGANALRTSHNMPAPELLDLCDKMGILVMDESFDCWLQGKKPNDYHNLFQDWHEKDLRAEYRRDRNHPSVILWSLGNEINEQGQKQAVPLVTELVGIAHDEDPTRPTTMGSNHIQDFDPDFVNQLDVLGENYDPGMYGGFAKKYPAKALYGSETASTCSSRGVYFIPGNEQLANFQVTSYDTYTPGWATLVDNEFKALDQNPFVAGEFVWTGFDYLGEPTPYNADMTNLLNFRENPEAQAKLEEQLKQFGKIKCPARSSYFGIVDLCGFKKDRFYLYQARWRPDLPMVHLLPHWNWKGQEGQKISVYAYSSGDEVELFLNGESLGRKKLDPFQYRFKWDDVVYAPGELRAVAYKGGQSWAETTVKTTGDASNLLLEADRPTIRADGTDLCYITTRVADNDGLTVPTAQSPISFAVSGPGEIVATDNGDPTDLVTFSSPQRKAFNGMALAIVRFKAGAKGDIHVSATSDGLKSADCVIHAE